MPFNVYKLPKIISSTSNVQTDLHNIPVSYLILLFVCLQLKSSLKIAIIIFVHKLETIFYILFVSILHKIS